MMPPAAWYQGVRVSLDHRCQLLAMGHTHDAVEGHLAHTLDRTPCQLLVWHARRSAMLQLQSLLRLRDKSAQHPHP